LLIAAAAREKEDSMQKALVQKEIRVGIIGADTKASWAKVSHVPAIKGLPGLKLAAVATRNEQSAREAAEAFGADRWFSDPFAMIHDDRIDLITVAVKVPAHRELVLVALGAGKAVYCEAPLGCSVPETEEMAHAVRAHHTAERSTLILSAICMRVPTAQAALSTHFTTPDSSRL
jgi:predicted dehydrogenase